MRLELAGSLVHPDPLVLSYNASQNFDTAHYINLGFTHFEVICIGAGGGTGGGIDPAVSGGVRCCGGAGGGGGFHRVRGLLAAIPALCPIEVGVGGAVGASSASDPAQTTDGGDGGHSTFNAGTCRASGGEGGKRVQAHSNAAPTYANGGAGGAGARTTAGGGAAGGVCGTPSATGPGAPSWAGADGTFFNNIGKGGGGGAGGVITYDGPLNLAGTAGGRGSYNPGDTSVYGPGGHPSGDRPGGASGAKAAPLSGLPTVYGQSRGDVLPGNPGIVVIRLTAE